MREPVYLRGSIWWCRVRNPNGGRAIPRTTRCRDRKAAVLVWREYERQSVTPPDQTSNHTALSKALDDRIAERRAIGRADGTISMLKVKARQLNRVLGADTPLSRIDATAVDGYVVTRVEEGAKRTTIHKELVTLRGALRLAKRQGKFARDLADVMPLDFSPEYEPKRRALSETEIVKLAGALAEARRPLFYFLLASGATYPSEVVNMQKGDVDARRWMVTLRGTKRSTRFRTVPIVSFARPWLTLAVKGLPFPRWSNIRRDFHVACARLSTCTACLKADRVKPKKGCKGCAAVHFAPISPNDLRRTTATLMRARGVEPSLLGAFLGHGDSRMAERVYGKLAPEQLAHLLDQRLRATARIQRSA